MVPEEEPIPTGHFGLGRKFRNPARIGEITTVRDT
jgi:hypothetical protein